MNDYGYFLALVVSIDTVLSVSTVYPRSILQATYNESQSMTLPMTLPMPTPVSVDMPVCQYA